MTTDPWANLRQFTDARIGLGRSGAAMPTREVLNFALSHAMARDAVTTPLDWAPIEQGLHALGLETVRIKSASHDRSEYLRRPDLGRRLSSESREALQQLSETALTKLDLVVLVGDGLSSMGVAANVVSTMSAFLDHARRAGWQLGPVLLADDARVALGDEAGEILGAKAVLVLIGERPGLSSPDSLGAYLTFAPRVGLKDADRNCISNIRPRGLSYDEAAFKAAWLLREALRRGLSGVNLKDESQFLIEGRNGPELLK
ncbi:ethanolamine ammonia-lyase subunit EutC [Hyphomicrobium sp.]|jgi:ethanolamine ammonia-lyase small subunit|uniref:ethanolamine ammonia-lyase subunit EutC n=1 Tax=Hyphomicrobium sp. TaxID=82 RepID=UPI002B76FE62|nr:ethanolamine ammonia-lyase subunit EutC [Hyphomicrobium sp.]HVZ04988.1 ethanolamine ammonia-lyase subunit EutC [Hyphomicrobium sp.]